MVDINYSSSNPLLIQFLQQIIKYQGFIPLDRFIEHCLHHPQYGYYCTQKPIGQQGDFITAPEISQLFGEMIAFWIINQWVRFNYPARLNLIEFGPGKGTLMQDILRVLTKLPNLVKCLRVHLVEINPHLIKSQQQLLIFTQQYNIPINWYSKLEDIPQPNLTGCNLIIANEFLDALSTKQYKYIKSNDANQNWHEVVVSLDKQQAFQLSLNKICSTTPNRFISTTATLQPGMIFEYSPNSLQYLQKITNLLQESIGSALLIDYGYTQDNFNLHNLNYTNTIQALAKHQRVNFLQYIGTCDITFLVNFSSLTQWLQSHKFEYTISSQRIFLHNLGIITRAKKLIRSSTYLQKHDIITGIQRILNKNSMGNLFKVLEIYARNAR